MLGKWTKSFIWFSRGHLHQIWGVSGFREKTKDRGWIWTHSWSNGRTSRTSWTIQPLKVRRPKNIVALELFSLNHESFHFLHSLIHSFICPSAIFVKRKKLLCGVCFIFWRCLIVAAVTLAKQEQSRPLREKERKSYKITSLKNATGPDFEKIINLAQKLLLK